MTTYDCVVIGGGLAGLSAATDLARDHVDVLVLEASDRVGGRTVGVPVASGVQVDGGASYFGGQHAALGELVDRFGLRTATTDMSGASVFQLGGKRHRLDTKLPPLSPVGLGDLFDALEGIVASLDLADPVGSADGSKLNAMSAAQWISEKRIHPSGQAFFPHFVGETMAAEPDEVSALHLAFFLKSGGGLRYLNAFEGGAQERRIVDGAHQVSALLAAELGSRVRLRDEVRSISREGGCLMVRTPSARFSARTVVVAVAPQVAARLDIDPLPRYLGRCARYGSGAVVKVHLVFDRPYWREVGLSGWSLSDSGPVGTTVDSTPNDPGSPGVITGFVTGAKARRHSALPAQRRERAVRQQFAGLFPEIPEPKIYLDTDWITEPYSSGCYAALLGPGQWTEAPLEIAAVPENGLIWAGTETSREYFGSMDGAVRSGHRAAWQVMAELDTGLTPDRQAAINQASWGTR